MGETYETWILERHLGAWKVVCCNVMASRSPGRQGHRIALDAEGRVAAMDDRCRDFLSGLDTFTIRDGRLRATDPKVDAGLQATIRRAGELQGYFEQAAFAAAEGQRFACPIVLERHDGAGPEIVMLTVQDRSTYLDFNTGEVAASRVDASALIFGLSEGQHKVARGIVAGQSLPVIASDLGIGPATAKTHLQRVCLKTGTTTMTALVRCLMSVG